MAQPAAPGIRLISAAALLLAVPTPAPRAAASPAAQRCAALRSLVIPAAAIAAPTRGGAITSAWMSPAGDPNGEYCRVEGAIHPLDPGASDIRFGVNLPADWNRKAVQFGGGGYDGTLVDGLSGNYLDRDGGRPVARGFATFGSDSGHRETVRARRTRAVAAFALNAEELANYGGAQLKKVRDAAMVVVRARYGSAPRRLYFYGSSQGGHEGLIVAQRWPHDYDGVVAIHPAYDFVALQLSGLHLAQVLYRTPGAWLSPEKIALLAAAVLRTCDGLDGVRDGLISNVAGCRSAFQLETLRCPSGADEGPHCLSDPQLGSVRAFDSAFEFGFELPDGVHGFGRWPILQGGFGPGAVRGGGLGTRAVPDEPPNAQDAMIFIMADQLVRFMVMRDAHYRSLQFDPDRHVGPLQALSRIIDANSADLDAFRARGGKLLLMHGTVDTVIAPENSIAYYERLAERYGGSALRQFTRFYLVPGFGHGDGPFQVSWDSLRALDEWVEQGREPVNQVAVDTALATAGRSRPLCEYPSWPQYHGSGDVDDARSYRCVTALQ